MLWGLPRRAAATLIAASFIALAAMGGVHAESGGSLAHLGLDDGAQWLAGTARFDGVRCLTVVVAGVIDSVGRGQAALVEVEGIAHIGLFFAQNAPVSVRAAATAAGVSFDVRGGYSPDASGGPYERAVEVCRAGGNTFTGEYAVWAYHTDGVRADASRIEADGGSIALAALSRGRNVDLWNSRDFEQGVAVEFVGPSAAGVATGESVLLGARLTVDSPHPVFGTFVLFELAETWQLAGPDGAFAYRTDLAAGGNLDALSFRGDAGTWSARVDRSVSVATPGQAFFVLARLDAGVA